MTTKSKRSTAEQHLQIRLPSVQPSNFSQMPAEATTWSPVQRVDEDQNCQETKTPRVSDIGQSSRRKQQQQQQQQPLQTPQETFKAFQAFQAFQQQQYQAQNQAQTHKVSQYPQREKTTNILQTGNKVPQALPGAKVPWSKMSKPAITKYISDNGLKTRLPAYSKLTKEELVNLMQEYDRGQYAEYRKPSNLPHMNKAPTIIV